MFEKKILAHWCYCNNFGDALNPYLLSKLSGKKVKFCTTEPPKFRHEFMEMLRCFKHLKKYDFRKMTLPVLDKPVLLPIGSIMSRSHSNYIIWGAGFMDRSEHSNGGTPYLLRGPFSAKKFEDEGYGKCNVFGDPALLLPLVYKPHVEEIYKYGIIPHMIDLPAIRERYPKEKIINLKDGIEKVIDSIKSCEYIISTSLHGVIVAHAYGVPAIWVKRDYIYTDGIKFDDYFASVGIALYDGGNFTMSDFVGKTYCEIPEKVKTFMLPHISLQRIQKSILESAPFMIKKEILDKLK